MKRFSDLQSTEQLQSTIIENSIESSDSIQNSFPEYMLNDSVFVGYQDFNLQSTIYRAAEFATIVTGLESVLDVGCGRGDFGQYLLKRYPQVKYKGIDLNNIMIELGQTKHSTVNSTDRFNLENGIFNSNYMTNEKFDYVYHITNLSIDYGLYPNIHTDDNKYQYLKSLIEKSLDLCNVGVVFMLLNDKEDIDGYINYSLTPVSKILYDLNVKFAIDNTDIHNVYKLLILKNNF